VIREAAAYANANPEVIRSVTAREQKVDPATLADTVVPYFYERVDLAGIDRFQQLMVEFGLLKQRSTRTLSSCPWL
jgi:hypothetical protein